MVYILKKLSKIYKKKKYYVYQVTIPMDVVEVLKLKGGEEYKLVVSAGSIILNK